MPSNNSQGSQFDPLPDPARRKGSVVLRHEQAKTPQADALLLDSNRGIDFTHTDPWRVLRIQSEFVEGFGTLSELGPAVSVFGSARTARGTERYEQAEQIGLLLAASVAGQPLPLTAVLILYINLATDGLPALALSVDPPEPDLMQHRPRDRAAGIFTRPVVALIALGGV